MEKVMNFSKEEAKKVCDLIIEIINEFASMVESDNPNEKWKGLDGQFKNTCNQKIQKGLSAFKNHINDLVVQLEKANVKIPDDFKCKVEQLTNLIDN